MCFINYVYAMSTSIKLFDIVVIKFYCSIINAFDIGFRATVTTKNDIVVTLNIKASGSCFSYYGMTAIVEYL